MARAIDNAARAHTELATMDHCSLTDAGSGDLPHSPAAARNAEPILAELQRLLPASGRVLEIASGTGQHAVHFATHLPALRWQPSDTDADALGYLHARVARAELSNLAKPIELDTRASEWALEQADAIVCINLLHIAPWEATLGLLAGAGRLLPAGGVLVIYGPFRIGGAHTAASNARFDADLHARDPRWGIRELEAVATHAAEQGLEHTETCALPANNHVAVFRNAQA